MNIDSTLIRHRVDSESRCWGLLWTIEQVDDAISTFAQALQSFAVDRTSNRRMEHSFLVAGIVP